MRSLTAIPLLMMFICASCSDCKGSMGMIRIATEKLDSRREVFGEVDVPSGLCRGLDHNYEVQGVGISTGWADIQVAQTDMFLELINAQSLHLFFSIYTGTVAAKQLFQIDQVLLLDFEVSRGWEYSRVILLAKKSKSRFDVSVV